MILATPRRARSDDRATRRSRTAVRPGASDISTRVVREELEFPEKLPLALRVQVEPGLIEQADVHTSTRFVTRFRAHTLRPPHRIDSQNCRGKSLITAWSAAVPKFPVARFPKRLLGLAPSDSWAWITGDLGTPCIEGIGFVEFATHA